jgi:hypothetical protein
MNAEGQEAGSIIMSTALLSLRLVAQAKREGPNSVVTGAEGGRKGRQGIINSKEHATKKHKTITVKQVNPAP